MSAAPEAIYRHHQLYVGVFEEWNRTIVKISDSDCLLEDTSADGALGSATGRVEDGEAFLRPSSSCDFSFILTASIEDLIKMP
jgi:hypothetical protein